MDEVFTRFLHLAEQIYEKLDDRSLSSSRVVARSWNDFVDYKDYPWTRIQNMVADLKKNCKDDGSLPCNLLFANPFVWKSLAISQKTSLLNLPPLRLGSSKLNFKNKFWTSKKIFGLPKNFFGRPKHFLDVQKIFWTSKTLF